MSDIYTKNVPIDHSLKCNLESKIFDGMILKSDDFYGLTGQIIHVCIVIHNELSLSASSL